MKEVTYLINQYNLTMGNTSSTYCEILIVLLYENGFTVHTNTVNLPYLAASKLYPNRININELP